MQVIKNGRIVQDDWIHLGDEEPLSQGKSTVSLARWSREKDAILASGFPVGVRVSGDQSVTAFCDDLGQLSQVCIEMPAMADGRCFSLARLLRDRYRYSGEIRVRGDFIRDQMFFFARVGVNAFEFGQDQDLDSLLPVLSEFSVKYQAAADEKLPLYRRRKQ